jgi:hypothetical protein
MSSTTSLTAASAARLKGVLHKVGKAGSAVHALATNTPLAPAVTAGIVHGQVLNCYKAFHDYLTKMVSAVPGMKALLLDAETVRAGERQTHTCSHTRGRHRNGMGVASACRSFDSSPQQTHMHACCISFGRCVIFVHPSRRVWLVWCTAKAT